MPFVPERAKILPRRISGTCALHQRKLRDGDDARAPAGADSVHGGVGEAIMEVILREHVDHLGKRGEIVKVADGYARNYLLPRKLALPATDGNKQARRARAQDHGGARGGGEGAGARRLRRGSTAIDIAIARRVGDTEQLYGSVTSADIADFLKAKGFEIDRRKLILPEPIKAIGEHTVPLKLHREVTVPLKVQVVKEGAAASHGRACGGACGALEARGFGHRTDGRRFSPPFAVLCFAAKP